MKRLTHILVSASLLVGASSGAPPRPGLHREGEFWVDTSGGSVSDAEGAQLKIVSLGNITVRGGERGPLTYTVTRRIHAHSEAEARAMLQEAAINFTRQGRLMRLVVDDSAGPVEMQVTAPRSLEKLLIGTQSGNVDVSDLEGSVNAETGAGQLRVRRVKGNVNLDTGGGGSLQMSDIGGSARAVSAGGDITAGAIGGDAIFETAGGNVTIQKAGGNVRAATAGGVVRVGEAGGAVIADTMGGMIDIGRAGGAVTARNGGGGPIQIGSALAVKCDSAGGAIKLGSVAGGMRVSTASGSIVVQLTSAKLLSDSLVSTRSGDITVFIPSDLGVTIRARNDGSTRRQSILSDFPELKVNNQGVTVTALGSLHGGGPVLRIECTGGVISIKKK